MTKATLAPRLELDDDPVGVVQRRALTFGEDAAGQPFWVPVLSLRAAVPGPTLLVTGAVHGDELNGMRTIHTLFEDPPELECGALVGVPVVNVPGFVLGQREFLDGKDLNRVMPGKDLGPVGPRFAAELLEVLLGPADYLLDLHTAGLGRRNTVYARVDFGDPPALGLARAFAPTLVVHKEDGTGTLRSAARLVGVPAVTFELGNPLVTQRKVVAHAHAGVLRVLQHLGMVQDAPAGAVPRECVRSAWVYTPRGGVLEVLPNIGDEVAADEVVGRVRDLWGTLLCEIRSPATGVIVGRSESGAAHIGAHVVHVGILRAPDTGE